MIPWWTIALVAAAASLAAVMAARYANAANARRARRDGCPFENDDDEARPLAREAADVLRETVAFARALLPVPTSSLLPSGHRALVVVVVPEWGLPAASLASLARRLVTGVTGAHVAAEPRRHPWVGTAARVERLAEHVDALGRAPDRPSILLLGHGRGGLVAARAAAAAHVGARVRAVTVATAHAPTDHLVGSGLDLYSLYSLHDAFVTPPERAYVAGAVNIVVRGDGHFGIVRSRRTAELLRETLLDDAAPAVAS